MFMQIQYSFSIEIIQMTLKRRAFMHAYSLTHVLSTMPSKAVDWGSQVFYRIQKQLITYI